MSQEDKKVTKKTTAKKKRKIPAFFTEEEKALYRTLSKEQRGHIQYMGQGRARNYLFNCINEKTTVTGEDIMKEISGIADSYFDDRLLSKKVNEADLKEKEFKCKFCGQGFKSSDMRDKHQKICM